MRTILVTLFDNSIYERNIMENNETERTMTTEEVISLIGECTIEELCTIQDTIEERVILLFHKKVLDQKEISFLLDEIEK